MVVAMVPDQVVKELAWLALVASLEAERAAGEVGEVEELEVVDSISNEARLLAPD